MNPADLARFNSGIALARAAYTTETTCKDCGGPIDRNPNRLPSRCPSCKEAS